MSVLNLSIAQYFINNGGWDRAKAIVDNCPKSNRPVYWDTDINRYIRGCMLGFVEAYNPDQDEWYTEYTNGNTFMVDDIKFCMELYV